MKKIESEWNGYKRFDFEFQGKNAILIIPKKPTKDKKWLFKLEYFGAFPHFEIQMLEKGYYIAHVDNNTRWCMPDDTERQYNFAVYLQKEFDLNPKCMPVGMSCGGMQAVYLAAKHSDIIAAIYLDAPVLNLLSCPCGVGLSDDSMYQEFVDARGITVSDLINYRNHPIDYAENLIKSRIPLFLICGDSDKTVPFVENGKILLDKYQKSNCPVKCVLKQGCDHHPHGLDDNSSLIEFVIKYY